MYYICCTLLHTLFILLIISDMHADEITGIPESTNGNGNGHSHRHRTIDTGSYAKPKDGHKGKKNLKTTSDDNKSSEHTVSSLEIYRHLFREKRKTHSQAVKAILDLPKYEKRYDMLNVIYDKMFATMREAKVVLMESGYTPGDPFPTDNKVKEVLSVIVENTVFFGDLLLHLPDITHDLLKRNNEWVLIIRWCTGFVNETGIYEKADGKVLHLMSQELGIIEKDADYINPYKAAKKDLKKELEKLVQKHGGSIVKDTKEKKKKEKKKKKGPRLSSMPHTEL